MYFFQQTRERHALQRFWFENNFHVIIYEHQILVIKIWEIKLTMPSVFGLLGSGCKSYCVRIAVPFSSGLKCK